MKLRQYPEIKYLQMASDYCESPGEPPAWNDSLQHIGLQGTINQSETHPAVIPHSSGPRQILFRCAHVPSPPPTTHNHQLFIPNCLEESLRVQGMGKFMRPGTEANRMRKLCTHDRAAAGCGDGDTRGRGARKWRNCGRGRGYKGVAGRRARGKGKSPSQTTKRHVVNKFSIKFKVTQNKQKRGKMKKKRRKNPNGGRYPKEHGAEHYITFACYGAVCVCVAPVYVVNFMKSWI